MLVSYLKRNFFDFLVILEHRSCQILNFLTMKAGFIAVPNQQISKQKKKPTLSEGRFISFSKSKCLQEKCSSQL